ncbi:PREDICTED: probable nucleoside diphosphate kinase 5, partial [Ceratosolen solmsi marchali]|uniref:Probable nucleoside diphosphate kinase 5 n=1 Tax=Ceratosolen solmsi marchali TaxID=326594 RepID=A0AAJ7DWT5_9HYME
DDKDSSKPCSCSSNDESSLKPCTCISEESSLKTCVCSSSCDSLDTDTTIDRPQDLPVECTLAIIKPDGMMYRNEIEREIIDEGFKICQRRWLQLTPEQVSDFYFDNYKRRNFAHLITYMSSEPILVFVLAKCNAIKEWKSLIGPKKVTNARIYAPDSIRGKYGRKGDDMKNTVHGSDSPQAAEREIHFFFPDRIEEPLLDEEDTVEYLKKYVNGPLFNALVKVNFIYYSLNYLRQCCEERPNDPVTWLGNWLLEHNTMKPKYLLRYKSNLYD